MKKIDLEQGSALWLEWRRSGVGASDFPCIVKKNPFCTVEEIYRAKTDPAYQSLTNLYIERGKENESVARELFEMQMGAKYPPLCCASDKSDKYLASLDGFNEKYEEVVEIKVPSAANYEKYIVTPPEYQFYQVQWQLFVSGAKTGYLFYYSPERQTGHIKIVEYDEKLIEECLSKVDYFLECLTLGRKPDKLMSFPLILEDTDLEKKLEQYFDLKNQVDALTKKMQELKSEIIFETRDDNVKVGSYQIRKQVIYRIDYKKACEDKKIDLTSYKKEGTESWTILKK